MGKLGFRAPIYVTSMPKSAIVSPVVDDRCMVFFFRVALTATPKRVVSFGLVLFY